jgi:hypothetical protein
MLKASPFKSVYKSPKMTKDTTLRELIIQKRLVTLACNEIIWYLSNLPG